MIQSIRTLRVLRGIRGEMSVSMLVAAVSALGPAWLVSFFVNFVPFVVSLLSTGFSISVYRGLSYGDATFAVS
jgi:hypothetical protein